MLHADVSFMVNASDPFTPVLHSRPFSEGAGLEQLRVRSMTPVPQVTEHDDHCVHPAQLP